MTAGVVENGRQTSQKRGNESLPGPLTILATIPRLVKVEIAVSDVLVDQRLALRNVRLHRFVRGLREGFDPGAEKLPRIDRVSTSVKALKRSKRLSKRLHRTFTAVVPTGFGFDVGCDVPQELCKALAFRTRARQRQLRKELGFPRKPSASAIEGVIPSCNADPSAVGGGLTGRGAGGRSTTGAPTTFRATARAPRVVGGRPA